MYYYYYYHCKHSCISYACNFSPEKQKFTEPRVHAFVYEPGTGEIQRLPVDFGPYIDDLQDIYNVYSVSSMSTNSSQVIK
jgi:hypothetical protein